ncbi:hypothetical protein R1flu_013832 [Riccia fluitans]|uniref:Uncharacterized protein n=1 Tax=Riccia fluitans TaxID=41844 RepID=A0ABD1YEE0_9MARC
MPAARSQGSQGSPGGSDIAGGDENGADGQCVVDQEENRERKSVKRAAESSTQVTAGEVGREGKKPLGRPRKRPKPGDETPVQTTGENGTGPEKIAVTSADDTQKYPKKRNRQRSTSRVLKTNDQKSGSSSEALESSETPTRLRRRRASRDVAGQSANEQTPPENGSKILRSHMKATTLASTSKSIPQGPSAPVSSEDKTGTQQDDEVGGQPRRRRRRAKSGSRSQVDDKEKIKRRVKNLVNRIRLEQNLIDAYAGEGWKGQSREKIRPEKELERAEKQILRCKLAIRENVHELDKLALEGTLQQSAFDEEGRIYHEEIFCAKCKSQEAHADNDIILCDGACDRGFHQNCLEPPLATDDIPPGDEGWLCPVCDAKVECFNYMNSYMGTDFHVEDQWEDLFREDAAKAAAGADTSNAAGEDWPSEDSEDDDYDPERPMAVKDEDDEEKKAGISLDSSGDSESESEATSGSTASSDDDSGDDSPVSGDELVHQAEKRQKRVRRNGTVANVEDAGYPPRDHADILAAEEEEVAVVSGKRHRKPVDYKKLHDEMFGKEDVDDDSHPSEDEEWGPGRVRGKGKGETSSGELRLETNDSEPGKEAAKEQQKEPGKALKRRNRRNSSRAQGSKDQHPQSDDGKTNRRLPDNAVEVLRQEFDSGACFPTRDYKANLAERLGITYQQICSWFKNARHAAKVGISPAKLSRKKEDDVATVLGERPGGGADGLGEMEVTNGLLVEKLDDVQVKLQQLKHTLEAVVSPETSNGNGQTGATANGTHGNGASTSGSKRIIYMPVAEVVEKKPC